MTTQDDFSVNHYATELAGLKEQLEAAREHSREASEMFLRSDAYVGELRAALEKLAAWPPHDGMVAMCEFARAALSFPARSHDA